MTAGIHPVACVVESFLVFSYDCGPRHHACIQDSNEGEGRKVLLGHLVFKRQDSKFDLEMLAEFCSSHGPCAIIPSLARQKAQKANIELLSLCGGRCPGKVSWE